MVYGKIWTAFSRWKNAEDSEEARAREVRAVNVMCRILNRQLDVAFGTWVKGVAFEKRCEKVLAKFAARVKLKEVRPSEERSEELGGHYLTLQASLYANQH